MKTTGKGRTTRFDIPDSIDWCNEDKIVLLSGWARDGYSLEEIANNIGISKSTLQKWRKRHEEIDNALKINFDVVAYKIENALIKSALGYRTKEEKITTIIRRGELIETVKEITDKEVAPSMSAIQFYLINRKNGKWKSTKNASLEAALNDENTEIKIEVTRAKRDADNDTKINDGVKVRRTTEEEKQEIKERNRKKNLDYWPPDWEDDED